MNTDNNHQLLQQLIEEFRDFRNEIQQWRLDTTERVVTLETKMTDLHGNGQKGRVSKVEEKADKLEKYKYLVVGGASVVSVVVSILFIVIKEFLK